MPDITDRIVERLRLHRIAGIPSGPDMVFPAYHGLSILNLPSSVSRWLGGFDLPHPALDLPILEPMAEGCQQVICVLVDALSLDRFRRWFDNLIPALDPASERSFLGALTSVVPSTTSAALTSLWTGHSPGEHGILGYELLLREYGLVANMITHAPMTFEGSNGLLYRAGFRPESALPVPTWGPQLRQHGITAHAFLANSILHSGLSRMHYEDVQVHGFGAPSDLWIAVRELAESPIEHRRLIWVYYGDVDGLSHHYGPDSEQARAEFVSFMRTMYEQFIEPFDGDARRPTLLMLLSDHGQISTPLNPHYEIRNHPTLIRRLHILPTGENRLAYLYSRPGQVEALQEYFERTWPGSFSLYPSSLLLEVGLFGPGKPCGAALARIGDLTAVSHGDAYLWWAMKENPLLGRHGGLHAEEMLVPLYVTRLD